MKGYAMKRISFSILSFLLVVCLLFCSCIQKQDKKASGLSQADNRPYGTAVIITGAAARIPQEAALLEELYNRGLLKNVVFISGVSSGALNTVLLNAILGKKFTWDRYKAILFGLTNDDVYIQNERILPVNTQPLRELLKRIAYDSLGYHTLADLPYPSAFSIARKKVIEFSERTYRLSNMKFNAESDPTLDLVDVLMASTCFPIAFPPVRIVNTTTIPDEEYIDGGVASDHIPFEALIEYEKWSGKTVEKVYIVSRKSDTSPDLGKELTTLGLKDYKLLDDLGITLDDLTRAGYIRGMKRLEKEAPDLAARTYVYFPTFPEDFLIFDFSHLQDQYNVASHWAKDHDPIPLLNYMQQNLGIK
jgi:predicted acylesterase/phospholipase RssA